MKHVRLVRCLQWQGILSRSEAEAGLRGYQQGNEYNGEAVAHYGGMTKLLHDAIRNRHIVNSKATGA